MLFCVALETGLLHRCTFDNPTIALSIPETVPVKVGEAKFALNLKRLCSS
jgi:hypothetical protein